MHMNDKLAAIKAALSAAVTAVAAFLGWRGILAVAWVVCMALDYISGTCAACKEGTWNSQAAREGLWHKGGMIVVVTVAGIADLVMTVVCEHLQIGFAWPTIVLPLVLAWYLITELGSILENAVKLGASVPGWLIRLMKTGLKGVENAAEEVLKTQT